MQDTIVNNKRIVKNTFFLYIRMLLVMGVSLFTVRIVLKALGVIDYGVYNVVGGITILFSFLSNTMAHASQRFFAYELGRDDKDQLKAIFKTNMTIYVLISIVVIFLTETVGLWFLNTKMRIPAERMEAANWIYQFSILSFIVSMLSTPYKAVILSREKMSIFAYLSILEALGRLIIAYLLLAIICDKLKLYAVFHFVLIGGIAFFYFLVCKKRYKECQFAFNWDKQYLKEILGYTGWSFYGHAAMSLRNQGVNIVLNLFFGAVVNAARGIAFQVNAAVTNLYMNFYVAVKPQIIKYYAQNNLKEMHNLIYRSSKFCYFLVLLVSVPLLLETPYILQLWLKNVPDYTVIFTRIVIITTMIDAISPGLQTSADATGHIRNYQLVFGTILMLNVPLCWLFLKWGCPPQSAMYIVMLISIITLLIKIFFAKKMVNLPIKVYFVEVLWKILLVTVASFIIPLVFFIIMNEGIMRFCFITIISISWSCGVFFLFGLSKKEKNYILTVFKNKLGKKYKCSK